MRSVIEKRYVAINSYGSFVRAVTVALYYNSISDILASTGLRPNFLYIIRLPCVYIQAHELQVRTFRKFDDIKVNVCVGQYSWLAG